MADKTSVELFYMQEARANASEGVEVYRQRKLDSGFGSGGRNVYVGDMNALRASAFQPFKEASAIERKKQALPEKTGTSKPVSSVVERLQSIVAAAVRPAEEATTSAEAVIHEPIEAEAPHPAEAGPFVSPALTDPTTFRSLPLLKLLDSFESDDDDTVVAIVLPVYGKIAAGQPLSDSDYLDGEEAVDISLLGEDVIPDYLLRIQGDSMIGDGIHDGDLVAVRSSASAEPGDLIVAMLDDGATVKRLIIDSDGLFLAPSNPEHSRLPIANPADLKVQGHVLGVVRR